jgi:uncharacterized protein (TIGR00266 family)
LKASFFTGWLNRAKQQLTNTTHFLLPGFRSATGMFHRIAFPIISVSLAAISHAEASVYFEAPRHYFLKFSIRRGDFVGLPSLIVSNETVEYERLKSSGNRMRQMLALGGVLCYPALAFEKRATSLPVNRLPPGAIHRHGFQYASRKEPRTMHCHEVDYELFGRDMQIVEIELDSGETVIAEAGAMNYMEDGISYEARMGDGSKTENGLFGKLLNVGKRVLTGESIFLTHFTNQGQEKRRVAFAAPYPGKIIPLEMSKVGDEILCQKDAFLAAALGTEVGIAFTKRLGAGFFGGEGFILQRLKGDGMVFLHAGGTVTQRKLNNDILRVDTGCLVAFTKGIDYDIQRAGSLKSMFFGGEGLFLATLSGTGIVLLQSLPFSRMADRILAHAPSSGGDRKGEGSVLGRFGGMLNGR